MDGIFGWLGDHAAHQELIKSMGRATRVSPEGLPHEHSNSMLGIAGCSRFGKATTHAEAGSCRSAARPSAVSRRRACRHRPGPWSGRRRRIRLDTFWREAADAPVRQLRAGSHRTAAQARVPRHRSHGGRAPVLCPPQRTIGVRHDARSVAAHPAIGGSVDLQAIYDYLYFHAIPSPRTLYHGIEKLLPGQCLSLDNGEAHVNFYWHADYTAEPGRDFGSYRGTFRELLREVVGGADDAPRCHVSVRRHRQFHRRRQPHRDSRRSGGHLFHRLRCRRLRRDGVRPLRCRALPVAAARDLCQAARHRHGDSDHCARIRRAFRQRLRRADVFLRQGSARGRLRAHAGRRRRRRNLRRQHPLCQAKDLRGIFPPARGAAARTDRTRCALAWCERHFSAAQAQELRRSGQRAPSFTPGILQFSAPQRVVRDLRAGLHRCGRSFVAGLGAA